MECKAKKININSTARGETIISTKEARKLLGARHAGIQDEFVERIVTDMTALSAKLLDLRKGSTKSKGVL